MKAMVNNYVKLNWFLPELLLETTARISQVMKERVTDRRQERDHKTKSRGREKN